MTTTASRRVVWTDDLSGLPDTYVPGRCAVCRNAGGVRYCGTCKAVICPDCRHRYFARGIAFVKAMTKGYHGEILKETTDGLSDRVG